MRIAVILVIVAVACVLYSIQQKSPATAAEDGLPVEPGAPLYFHAAQSLPKRFLDKAQAVVQEAHARRKDEADAQ